MDEFITTTEAAVRLGISSARVRQMVLSGELPAQKLGPVNMVKAGDLELVRNRRSVGRPKKEPEIEVAPGVKKWKVEQLALPAVAPTTKRAAKRAVAPKAKAVATKKGGKK